MTRRTSYQLSILFNALIFVIEAFLLTNRFFAYIPYSDVAFASSIDNFSRMNYHDLYRFDVVTNIMIALSSLFMLLREIKYLRNKRDYRRVKDFFVIFKLSSIILGMITFFMAYCFFIPFVWKDGVNVADKLFEFHYAIWAYTVMPWFTLITFVLFDRDPKTFLVKFLYVWLLPAIYVGAIIALSYFGYIKSPYAILDLKGTILKSKGNTNLFIYTMVAIFGGSYVLGVLILLLRNHFAKETELAGVEKINDGVGVIDKELVDTMTPKARKEYKKQKKAEKKALKATKKEEKVKSKKPKVKKTKATAVA